VDLDAVIEFRGIRFGYPGRPLLFDGLDLAFGRGQRVGLVGANGSGKTTLLHLIVGLQRPAAGTLTVLGEPARGARAFRRVRRQVGLLFQDSDDQLFCPTVGEDVAFGPLNLGLAPDAARRRAAEALQSLGVESCAPRAVHELSGGEKRLVALAGVLAMDPQVLLLDEPSDGLDPAARSNLQSRLAALDRTQVITSHDMEFIRATCRRVVLLDAGRLVADGPTDAVLGDGDLMLACGLEVPFSIEAEAPAYDHTHGAGVAHGHGHRRTHPDRQHRGGG
jgi:cobalt/nickel transport system ATP-binding protein